MSPGSTSAVVSLVSQTAPEQLRPEGDVGWWGVAASLLLIAVTVAISLWRRLGLEREVLWAVVRASGQLLAVGYVLTVVIDPDQPIAFAWAWLVFMVAFAAWTVSRRAPEVPGVLALAGVALAASTAVTVTVVFGLGIFPPEARAIVPIGGMMVGNAMSSTVVAGRRILEEFADKRPEVEARLALGQDWREAARPSMRSAMRTGMTNQIETTKAVGLVFLPGAMTGLILAGVDPAEAVRVQAAIMFLILGAVAINVVVIGTGVTRRLFTADHRLVRVSRSAS
ncbi:MAG: iron export ABC transporter permease subunit FetB [Acidimicrobiales bacterium]|nr:iron export ABC transporter permease subunit FetB [Acidimicrobiales bacterium]